MRTYANTLPSSLSHPHHLTAALLCDVSLSDSAISTPGFSRQQRTPGRGRTERENTAARLQRARGSRRIAVTDLPLLILVFPSTTYSRPAKQRERQRRTKKKERRCRAIAQPGQQRQRKRRFPPARLAQQRHALPVVRGLARTHVDVHQHITAPLHARTPRPPAWRTREEELDRLEPNAQDNTAVARMRWLK